MLDAWRHFHAGDFAQAVEAGIAAGGAGVNAAVKAQIDLRALPREDRQGEARAVRGGGGVGRRRGARKRRRTRTRTTSTRSRSGRYSQGISVAKALAQGFGGKIKDALLTALKLDAEARRRAHRVRRAIRPR